MKYSIINRLKEINNRATSLTTITIPLFSLRLCFITFILSTTTPRLENIVFDEGVTATDHVDPAGIGFIAKGAEYGGWGVLVIRIDILTVCFTSKMEARGVYLGEVDGALGAGGGGERLEKRG